MFYVLAPVSWYPGGKEPQNGDFIERQIEAVSAFVQVIVVFIEKEDKLPRGTDTCEKEVKGNLVIYRCFYGRSVFGAWFEKMNSYRTYRRLQAKIFSLVSGEYGKPGLVHVHVAMKAGLGGLLVKKKWGIPYLLTEHWAGYYRECKPGLFDKGPGFRILTRRIIKNCQLFLPVTENLGRTIQNLMGPVPFRALPNVVNTKYFFYQQKETKVFRFLHVSNMSFQKNPDGILRAMARLLKHGKSFEMIMIGKDDPFLKEQAYTLGLNEANLKILPAVSYPEVAKWMQASHAFVLFSRFENLPCVMLEALCCGLPVIATDVGGIREVLKQENGFLVPSEDEEGLADAMEKMMKQYRQFDRPAIASWAAARFSYEKVGTDLYSIYREMVDGDGSVKKS